VTVYVWLGGERLRFGAYGPKVRMVPIVSAGGKHGLPEKQDWSPMATDTSCELDRSGLISCTIKLIGGIMTRHNTPDERSRR
jgi:hypothetical protein